MDGQKLIAIANSYVGCHYLNGSYGAYPRGDNGDGGPTRKGGVFLIADPNRLDPKVDMQRTGFAVKAATMLTKGTQCVCAGRYDYIKGGRPARPDDQDLKDYLAKLGPDPSTWPNFYDTFTPRRAYGQGQNGALVWGEDCTEVRHFDCITYVNYCLWKLTGRPYSFEIHHWKNEPPTDRSKPQLNQWASPMTGSTVYRLSSMPNPQFKDGDILAGTPSNSEHIGFVASDGTVYQAQDTTKGVHADSKYKSGSWHFLIRIS